MAVFICAKQGGNFFQPTDFWCTPCTESDNLSAKQGLMAIKVNLAGPFFQTQQTFVSWFLYGFYLYLKSAFLHCFKTRNTSHIKLKIGNFCIDLRNKMHEFFINFFRHVKVKKNAWLFLNNIQRCKRYKHHKSTNIFYFLHQILLSTSW